MAITRLSEPIIFLLVASLGSVVSVAQKRSEQQPRSEQQTKVVVASPIEAGTPPKPPAHPLSLNEKDIEVAAQIAAALAAHRNQEVPKILQVNHMAIPRLQRVMNGIYLLHLEAQLSQMNTAHPPNVSLAEIQNLEEVKAGVASAIEKEFGGRTQNYQAAKMLVEKHQKEAQQIFNRVQGQEAKAP